MQTTIKLQWSTALSPALHYVSTDTHDIKHISGILKVAGTHVFTEENLSDLSVCFTKVNITVNSDHSGELELYWKDGVVENILSAIVMAIGEENIYV